MKHYAKVLLALVVFSLAIVANGIFAAKEQVEVGNLGVVPLKEIIFPEELKEEPFEIVFIPHLNTNITVDVDEATLQVWLVNPETDEVVAKKEIDLNTLEPTTLSFDYEDFRTNLKDGVLEVQAKITGYGTIHNATSNETYLSGFILKDEPVKIYIKTKSTDVDLDIVRVEPDFSVLPALDPNTRTVKILLKNDGTEDLDTVYTELRIINKYGITVYSTKSKTFGIDAGKDYEVELSIDTSRLVNGEEYTIEILAKDKETEDSEKIIYELKYYDTPLETVRVIDYDLFPVRIEPGDYVSVTLYLRNNFGHEVSVDAIVYNTELEVLRKIEGVNIDPFSTVPVKIVFKVPEESEGKTYYVNVKLRYEGKTFTTNFPLTVYGEAPVELDLSVEGPEEVKLNEFDSYKIILTSSTEELWNLKIEVDTDGEVILQRNEVVFGGKGVREEIPFRVKFDKTGEHNITVKVYDLFEGTLLTEKTISVKVPEKTEGVTEFLKDKITLVAAGIALLIAVGVGVYLYVRERKAE